MKKRDSCKTITRFTMYEQASNNLLQLSGWPCYAYISTTILHFVSKSVLTSNCYNFDKYLLILIIFGTQRDQICGVFSALNFTEC